MRIRITALVLAFLGLLLEAASAQSQIKMIALGHSSFASQAGPSKEGYPEQLQAALNLRGYDVTMLNAGKWGDTTSGVLGRLDRAVPSGTDVVLLAIGINDLRQGVTSAAVKKDVEAIISRLQAKSVEVVVLLLPSDSWTVEAASDVTVIKLPPLPPELTAIGHPTSAGNARRVEVTLPAVEQVIAKVRNKALKQTSN